MLDVIVSRLQLIQLVRPVVGVVFTNQLYNLIFKNKYKINWTCEQCSYLCNIRFHFAVSYIYSLGNYTYLHVNFK